MGENRGPTKRVNVQPAKSAKWSQSLDAKGLRGLTIAQTGNFLIRRQENCCASGRSAKARRSNLSTTRSISPVRRPEMCASRTAVEEGTNDGAHEGNFRVKMFTAFETVSTVPGLSSSPDIKSVVRCALLDTSSSDLSYSSEIIRALSRRTAPVPVSETPNLSLLKSVAPYSRSRREMCLLRVDCVMLSFLAAT